MLKIDEVAYNNALSNKNPYVKCTLAMGLLVIAISFQSFYLLGGIIIFMNVLLLGVAHIDFKFYVKMLLIPFSFLSLSVLTIVLTFTKDPTTLLGKVGCFGGYIGFTKETLRTATYLFMRCLASIHCIYFMTLTVGMNQLIKVLKKIHLPHEIIELIILMYRFIFIFLEEIHEMRLAQDMRFGYCNIKVSYKSTSLLISNLFTRVMKRYEDLCVVLEIKLYNGTFY